jgi:hypothetical protein
MPLTLFNTSGIDKAVGSRNIRISRDDDGGSVMRVIAGEPPHDPVITLWETAQRLYPAMDASYNLLSKIACERPDDDHAMGEAQARADALGRQYEQLCERICNMEARTLEGVLAKLRCATQCIRDTVPRAADPERTCDIELRFVFRLEQDVERLLTSDRTRSRLRNGKPARNQSHGLLNGSARRGETAPATDQSTGVVDSKEWS